MENKYLKETEFLDFSTENIQQFIDEFKQLDSNKEKAVKCYYKVRDGFRYDPYHIELTKSGLKASTIIEKPRAWCVEKAILMAACLRGLGIPARLGYGIVINHIGVEKLIAFLRREEIVFHGYVDVYLEDRWIKATPAFDPVVCKISGVAPLDWEGESDSMFQPYLDTKQFMEYIHFYGEFDDVPLQLMRDEMEKYYPHLFEKEIESKHFTFKFLE